MNKSILLVGVIFTSLMFNSCKNETTPPSKTDLLTNKTWKIITKAIVPSFVMGGITVTDITVMESDEMKAYTYKFNKDGTAYRYSASNQMIAQTSWSFNSDETQITFNPAILYNYPIVGDNGLSTMTLVSLSENQMVTTVPYLYDGTNFVITITFRTM